MIVRLLIPSTKSDQTEVMLSEAGVGVETAAVIRYLQARRLTLAAGIITREHGTVEEARRN